MKTSDSAYTGSRFCPYIDAVRHSIQITFASSCQFSQLDLKQDLPKDFVEMFNRAILYLLWHQFYAIAARGVLSPYIPLSRICNDSGVTTLTDKDSGSGHKTRLVWMPPELLKHMQQTEDRIQEFRAQHEIRWNPEQSPVFFLKDDLKPLEIGPKEIERLCKGFFPFPANTSRRVMRFMLDDAGLSSESVEMYLGHWRDRREPWGQWSSFDCSTYLDNLRLYIPRILSDLGFQCPPEKGKRKTTNGK